MPIERLRVAGNNEVTRRAKQLLQDGLIGCIEGTPPQWAVAAGEPPPTVKPWIDDLLSKQDTYRAGVVTIFCIAVANGDVIDMRPFSLGVRGVGEFTKQLLPHLSIPATRGNPFETISKGASSYVGRNRKAWNNLLTWASTEATFDEVTAVAAELVGRLASLRRHLSPMPALDTERLTWAAVSDVFDALLSSASRGVFEQLIVAALIESLYAEQIETNNVYVTTKPVNATDEASGMAGDIQVRFQGGRVLAAFEVADNDWEAKMAQAVSSMRREDLRKFLILAVAELPTGVSVEEEIERAHGEPEHHDVAVLDLRPEVRSMVARLDKVTRRRCLQTLYRYLVAFQPLDENVEKYVEQLSRRDLTV